VSVVAEARTLHQACTELAAQRDLRSDLLFATADEYGPSLLDLRIVAVDARIWELETVVHEAGRHVTRDGRVIHVKGMAA
jgi:hypothetical protein